MFRCNLLPVCPGWTWGKAVALQGLPRRPGRIDLLTVMRSQTRRSVSLGLELSQGETLHNLEMPAKQLILLEANSTVFSKGESLNNQSDFDSAIRRFAQERHCSRKSKACGALRSVIRNAAIGRNVAWSANPDPGLGI
jgi:hypothetical protein